MPDPTSAVDAGLFADGPPTEDHPVPSCAVSVSIRPIDHTVGECLAQPKSASHFHLVATTHDEFARMWRFCPRAGLLMLALSFPEVCPKLALPHECLHALPNKVIAHGGSFATAH